MSKRCNFKRINLKVRLRYFVFGALCDGHLAFISLICNIIHRHELSKLLSIQFFFDRDFCLFPF